MNKKIIAVVLVIVLGLVIGILLFPKAETFEVKFDTNGGSIVEMQTVKENSVAKRPVDPTKPGYSFAGWFLNEVKYDFSSNVNDNITLVAMWTKNETIVDPEPEKEKYVVTFNSNGGTNVESVTVEDGDKITKPVSPTKNGYTFVAWQLNGKNYDFNSAVTNNITLVAKWKNEAAVSTTIAVKNVVLSKTSLELTTGDKYLLEATINPSNATNTNVLWSSTNKSVVTVDASGNVKAVGVGSATITVSIDGKSSTCVVTVTKADTYDYKWEKIVGDAAGQSMLYIVKNGTEKVAGTVTITTKTGKTGNYDIGPEGLVFVESVITKVVVKSVK